MCSKPLAFPTGRRKARSGWALGAILALPRLKRRPRASRLRQRNKACEDHTVTIKLQFTDAKGDVIEGTGESGQSLLDVGQALGLPLEGTCEGQMACSTCHVIVGPEWFDRLPDRKSVV